MNQLQKESKSSTKTTHLYRCYGKTRRRTDCASRSYCSRASGTIGGWRLSPSFFFSINKIYSLRRSRQADTSSKTTFPSSRDIRFRPTVGVYLLRILMCTFLQPNSTPTTTRQLSGQSILFAANFWWVFAIDTTVYLTFFAIRGKTKSWTYAHFIPISLQSIFFAKNCHRIRSIESNRCIMFHFYSCRSTAWCCKSSTSTSICRRYQALPFAIFVLTLSLRYYRNSVVLVTCMRFSAFQKLAHNVRALDRASGHEYLVRSTVIGQSLSNVVSDASDSGARKRRSCCEVCAPFAQSP